MTGLNDLKFGDMTCMDMKLCKRVSKSNVPNGPCRNLPRFCPDESLVTTGQILLKFGDMIDMDMKFCKGFHRCPQGPCPTPFTL